MGHALDAAILFATGRDDHNADDIDDDNGNDNNRVGLIVDDDNFWWQDLWLLAEDRKNVLEP